MAKGLTQDRHFKTVNNNPGKLAFWAALNFAKESQADFTYLDSVIFLVFHRWAAISMGTRPSWKKWIFPYVYVAR